MKNFILKTYRQVSKLPSQEIKTYAGSTSFFLITAFVPFIMFLLALMQHVPPVWANISDFVSTHLPQSLKPVIDEILTDIDENGSAAMLSLSFTTAIYTAARGIFALMKGMNVMFGVDDDRSSLHKWVIAVIYTVLTVILILLTAVVMVLADTIHGIIAGLFPGIMTLAEFIINIRTVSMLCIMIFFFLLIYLFLPNRHSRLLHQIPGAIFSAFGWEIASAAFSFYLEHFSRYSQIYGSLTTIIVTMIWVYMLMSILFYGALINVVWCRILKKHTRFVNHTAAPANVIYKKRTFFHEPESIQRRHQKLSDRL